MKACILTILILAVYPVVYDAQAQSCNCITIGALIPNSNNHVSEIRVKVKNGCNRRLWFYTQHFWILVAEDDGNLEKGRMYKLRNDAPEAILMKWQASEELVFTTNIPDANREKIKISYSNTTKRHVRNLFGYATYNCEKTIKPDK